MLALKLVLLQQHNILKIKLLKRDPRGRQQEEEMKKRVREKGRSPLPRMEWGAVWGSRWISSLGVDEKQTWEPSSDLQCFAGVNPVLGGTFPESNGRQRRPRGVVSVF